MRAILFAVLLFAPIVLADAPSAKPTTDAPEGFSPTTEYAERRIHGWRILIHEPFLREHPDLAAEVLALLDHQLFQIPRVVPKEAVEKLRTVTIWVEREEGHHPCMAYHPDAGWLRDNGMNPDKARCVEVAHARHFLEWTTQQPWMVLHELAHAYHHQFLEGGFGNADLRAAHERAVTKEKRYDRVQRINGRRERAYAANDPMEFFAEASEAYFGTNDFYPYVRAELREHDPETFELIGRLWGK